MSESKSNTPELNEDDIFSIELSKLGSSEDLQARIVTTTAALPQGERASSNAGIKVSKLFPFTQKIVGAVAVAASLALAVLIWLPQGGIQDEVPDGLTPSELSLAELEFQDSILLQDELLFSSL